MRITVRRTIGLLIITAALISVGCIKAKQNILVMPDGSGRMDMTLGFNKQMMEQMGGQQGEDPTDIDVNDIADQSSGFVAFTEPVREEKDGWVIVTFSGYFEDISKVQMNTENAEEAPAYTFAEEGDGHRVEVSNGMTSSMINEMGEEDIPDDQRQMMLMMFAGFELSEAFTMPGDVADADGFPKVEGRTASVTIVDRDLINQEKLKELGATEPRAVTSGASTVSDAEVEAFHAEMEEAKEKWEQLKAEAAASQPAASQPAD